MVRRLLNLRKFLLRTILPCLRLLPLRFASRIIAGIGRTEYRHHAGLREGFQQAVERARSTLGCDWDVETVSLHLAGNQVLWRTRDLLLDNVAPRRLEPLFVVSGRDHLDAALAEGKGAIVLTSHYGGHLLPSHWLVRKGYPLRFYMERPRHVSKFLEKEFAGEGPLAQDRLFISRKGNAAGSAGSILRASRALKAGMLLYLAGDVRWTGPNTQSGLFMGRHYQFSATWVNLAALTGAPVIPVFCHMQPEGTYGIEFFRSFTVPSEAVGQDDVGSWVQSFLTLLEQQVRANPSNSNEYFFWAEAEPTAA